MKELVQYYKRVNEWNTKAGMKDHAPFTFEWWKSIELQTKLLVEEAKEAKDGGYYQDKTELLDGAVDAFIILVKLMDMLEKAGYDVVGALGAICSNNDEKIYDSYYQAVEQKDLLEQRDDVEYHVETAILDGLPFYSIRRMDGKIMKSVDFKAVDLEAFVP